MVNYGISVGLSRFVPAYQCILWEILESIWYLQVMSVYLQIVFLLKIQKFWWPWSNICLCSFQLYSKADWKGCYLPSRVFPEYRWYQREDVPWPDVVVLIVPIFVVNLIGQERIDWAISHAGFLSIVQLAFLYKVLQQVFLPLLLEAENALVD